MKEDQWIWNLELSEIWSWNSKQYFHKNQAHKNQKNNWNCDQKNHEQLRTECKSKKNWILKTDDILKKINQRKSGKDFEIVV